MPAQILPFRRPAPETPAPTSVTLALVVLEGGALETLGTWVLPPGALWSATLIAGPEGLTGSGWVAEMGGDGG